MARVLFVYSIDGHRRFDRRPISTGAIQLGISYISGLLKHHRHETGLVVLESKRGAEDFRLKSNAVLERHIQHLLTRPPGRPPKKPVVRDHDFMYQAASWDKARRVVGKGEWHQGDLFPRVAFIVTNLPWRCKRVVRFYNQRGTAEQWIKEGKNAVKWTKLSCHDFVDNQVRVQLFALAYNLGNFLRRLVLPVPLKQWTLTTMREKLNRIGAKVVRHSKYVFFQMAEVAVPRKLFAAILQRIGRLREAPVGLIPSG